ncbi:MAG: tRNA epoxyqueuosine(34) reductase QueG [Bacteroidetes bacterium]|nr:tRNA epoxyqueuosine(34) reductase QueG [Bacteroidota bacterium]
MTKTDLTLKIKEKAVALGFISCGISKAGFLEEEAPHLETWLQSGMHGKMTYMENHFDMRLNPALLVDGARSVISVLQNYYPKSAVFENRQYKISKYAYGEDYHQVVKDKLTALLDFIVTLIGPVNARCFTDSAPVLEKAWAKKSGLGWVGKNGNLLTQKVGSFYFIGEIIIDCDLDYDSPVDDHCGTCTSCIDACPTGAIIKPYVVDGSKCISYLTIELKDEFIPQPFKGKMEGWVFGCDICQDVCPWNRFSTPTSEERFTASPLSVSDEQLADLSEEYFKATFKNSPVKRAKYKGLKRNITFIDLTKK